MKIVIADAFKNDYTTRVAGKALRKTIKGTVEKITLDFSGVKIASASFFDEGIAKLTEENWDQNQFDTFLEFINLYEKDKLLLQQVCQTRGNISLKILAPGTH